MNFQISQRRIEIIKRILGHDSHNGKKGAGTLTFVKMFFNFVTIDFLDFGNIFRILTYLVFVRSKRSGTSQLFKRFFLNNFLSAFVFTISSVIKSIYFHVIFDIFLAILLNISFSSFSFYDISQWARKFKKVQAKKKLMKSNNSISRKNFFSPNSIFCNFKNGQKSFFELGKSF